MTNREYTYRWPNSKMTLETAAKYDEIVGEVNKTLLDMILSTLRKHGFKTKNLECCDSYFIFSGCPNSRCSFQLTGLLPGWHFGLWLEGQLLIQDEFTKESEVTDQTPVIQFFCQHDTLIDKFKPSRSPVCTEITLQDMKSVLGNENWAKNFFERQILAPVLAVKRHPILIYEDVCDPKYPPTHRLLPNAIKTATEDIHERIHDNIMLRMGVRWAKKMKEKAELNPAFTKVRITYNPLNEKIRMWPPVNILCELDEELTIDEQEDAIWDVFDTDEWGDLYRIGPVVKVEFWAGQGNDRGWYGFFEDDNEKDANESTETKRLQDVIRGLFKSRNHK